MLSWNDYYFQEEIRKDRMAEAEHARLVKSVTQQKEADQNSNWEKISWIQKLSLIFKDARLVTDR